MPEINFTLPVKIETIPEVTVTPGFDARFVHSQHATLAFWVIEEGSLLPMHSHPHERISYLTEGRFALVIDGKSHMVSAGEIVVIPPNTPHSGEALTFCRFMDVFHPVREDYRMQEL